MPYLGSRQDGLPTDDDITTGETISNLEKEGIYMVIGKRGPKSEKEIFATTLRMIGKSDLEIETLWEAHERSKMKLSTGKIQSIHAAKAEECVTLSKAFGGMDTTPSNSGKSNRDLERIAESFGDISRTDRKTFAGSLLEISQGALWFNADAPLRKLCDLAYAITSNPRISIREGSHEQAIVHGFVDNLRRAMSYDGHETQARILPALFVALDAFNDSISFPEETAE